MNASWPNGELPLEFLDRPSAFETLRSFRGRIFYLAEHLRRLEESCRGLGRELPEPARSLGAWAEASLKEFKSPEASLRLSIHWGGSGSVAALLFVRPFTSHPADWYRSGVTMETAAGRRWTLKAQDPQIKASQYVSGVLAYLDRGERVSHELLFLGPGGTVAEGTVSNLFMVKGKSLLTPSVGSGILKGVTRGIVIGLAKKRSIPVREIPLTRHDLYASDECFMTNTSSEVLPVVEIDARVIGGGRPGTITRRLAQDFKDSR